MSEESQSEDRVILQLGDIIEIEAQEDDAINKQILFVKYIDSNKLHLVNETTDVTLQINDGILDNINITAVNILNRRDDPGYATQNGLVKNEWINIHLGGEIPTIVIGQITDLNNDQIEIKTIDGDVLYIDFAYKGIPRDIPITKIEIREKPSPTTTTRPEITRPEITRPVIGDEEKGEEDSEGADTEGADTEGADTEGADTEDADTEGADAEEGPETAADVKVEELVFALGDIEFGEDLGRVSQVVELPESEQRYGIEKQTDDMLDVMLSTLPNADRTPEVLHNIHIMIERFKELRDEYSVFDDQNNAVKSKTHGANYKPLVESLEAINKKLFWILPVATMKKKIYDADFDAEINEAFPDVEPHTLAQVRSEEHEIMENYKNNTFGTENKYIGVLKKTHVLSTPFTNFDDNDEYSSEAMTTKEVVTPITAIIDNPNVGSFSSKDFSTSVLQGEKTNVTGKDRCGAMPDGNMKKIQFFAQDYTTSLDILETNKFDTRVKKATKNDKIMIKSFIALPEATLRFSRVSLPGSNIMVKADLNRSFLEYWRLLKKNTDVNEIYVDTTSPVDAYDKSHFIQNITHFKPATNDEKPDNISNEQQYRQYLDNIVPKTINLFNLLKSRIEGRLSLFHVIKYLEPFLVYEKDISFMQYSNIIKFVNEKIKEHKQMLNLNKSALSVLDVKSSDVDSRLKYMFEMSPNIYKEVMDGYDIVSESFTDDELYSRMMAIDGCRLLNAAFSMIATSLIISNDPSRTEEVEKLVNEKRERSLASNIDGNGEECNKYVIAKKYVSFDELQSDNDKTNIYFDKQYDNTYYDVIKEYDTELQDISENEKQSFLSLKLQQVNGLSANEASRDAAAMLFGKRVIQNGDYAVLENEESLKYYVRTNDKWMADQTVNEGLMNDETKLFCNFNKNCISVDDKCMNNDMARNNLQNDAEEEIIRNFDAVLEVKKKEITKRIENAYKKALKLAIAVRAAKVAKRKQNSLVEENDDDDVLMNPSVEPERSPYETIRDAILGQSDFAKKQGNIARFINNFTRPSNLNDGESKWWLYCVKTQIKLLPSFYKEISSAFINGEDYLAAIGRICDRQGVLGDDESVWVDKHSGYTIAQRSFDAQEGYTEEGFRINTRDILEDESVLLDQKERVQYENPDSNVVVQVTNAMERFLGVGFDGETDFIVRRVTQMMDNREVIFDKKKYEKAREKTMKKEGSKQLQPYETYKNKKIIFLTLCHLLVVIQTSIPGIRSGKQHPGCIKSFEGYPLYEEGNQKGIEYIACVANKIKSSIEPWNAIQRTKPKTMVKEMLDMMQKHIVRSGEVKSRIANKRASLLNMTTDKNMEINEESGSKTGFLPLLTRVNIKTISTIPPEFLEEFEGNMRSGKKLQHNKINAMRTKTIFLAIKVQSLIEETVEKYVANERAILSNAAQEPYLENACCWDDDKRPFAYFERENPSITELNNEEARVNTAIRRAKQLGVARILFVSSDTKTKFPKILDQFSEDTIYRAFITLCDGNSEAEELRSFCKDEDNENPNKTTEQKIQDLKSNNVKYSLDHLMNLVATKSRRNIIALTASTSGDMLDNEETLMQQLTTMNKNKQMDDDESDDETDEDEQPDLDEDSDLDSNDGVNIRKHEFFQIIYGNKNDSINTITSLKDNLLNAVRTNMSNRSFNDFVKDVQTIIDFGDDYIDENEEIVETTFDEITFSMNSLRYICCVFPNILSRKNVYSSNVIPKHWNLSENHVYDIEHKILKKFSKINDISKHNAASVLNEKTNTFLKQISEYFVIARKILRDDPSARISVQDLFEYCFFKSLNAYVDVSLSEQSFITDLISAMCKFISAEKKKTVYTYSALVERINRSKEKEKMDKLNRLGAMDDEAREVDNLKKYAKLGDEWGKGLQKNLWVYDQDTYDQERQNDITDVQNIQNTLQDDMQAEIDQIVIPSEYDDDGYDENNDGDEMY